MLLLLAISILSSANLVQASYSANDGIDGYVYASGVGKPGLTVHVYRNNQLEGYGFGHFGEAIWLGTDVTDANGFFRIAYLAAHGYTYRVEVLTEVGTLIQEGQVNCGATTHVRFDYEIPVNPSGKLIGNPAVLEKLGNSIRVRMEISK